ncbi:MAG: Dimethylargininase [Deltaproteobacteria bacterium]|nr:Dimethylargininase [Deltaproteobacteria bacterium]
MPIDTGLARTQHAAYCMALEAIGLEVTTIPADDRHPDCCFIEDTAVIAAGLALITRPGASSRQGEPAAVAPVLAAHLELATMTQPATLDGGDCMQVGTTLYVGRSTRTNAAGIARVAEVFAPRGLRVVAVDVPSGVLHLKCVCSPLGGDRLLLARDSIPSSVFGRADIVWVPASETFAANAVALGTHVVVAAEYPRTRDALAAAGFETHAIATTEIRKADGSLTCQSLVLEAA